MSRGSQPGWPSRCPRKARAWRPGRPRAGRRLLPLAAARGAGPCPDQPAAQARPGRAYPGRQRRRPAHRRAAPWPRSSRATFPRLRRIAEDAALEMVVSTHPFAAGIVCRPTDSLAALLYHQRVDRTAQGGHAQPRQHVARRGRRGALPRAGRGRRDARGAAAAGFDYGQNQLLSTWYAGGSVAPLDYLTRAT